MQGLKAFLSELQWIFTLLFFLAFHRFCLQASHIDPCEYITCTSQEKKLCYRRFQSRLRQLSFSRKFSRVIGTSLNDTTVFANFDAFCAKDELKEVLCHFYVDFLILVWPLHCRAQQRYANPNVSSRIYWFWLEVKLFFLGLVYGLNVCPLLRYHRVVAVEQKLAHSTLFTEQIWGWMVKNLKNAFLLALRMWFEV